MRVMVACFGALKDHLPPATEDGRVTLDVAGGATVADVVAVLGMPAGAIYSTLVDGDRVGLDHPLTEGAEVTLMPPFSGGST